MVVGVRLRGMMWYLIEGALCGDLADFDVRLVSIYSPFVLSLRNQLLDLLNLQFL